MQYPRGESIEARGRTLRRLARWADTAIRSWKLIDAQTDVDGSTDFLNPHRPYLVVAAHGHRELGLLYLNALFESRTDTVNIEAVRQHLQKHGFATATIKADINQHRDALKKLYMLRGAAIGHRTGARSYDETFAAARMTVDELDSLLDLASRSTSALAKLIGLPPEPPRIDPVENLDKMLQCLADTEQRERMASPWN